MSESVIARRDDLGADEARQIWPARLIIGMTQGLLLWWLWRSGTGADDPIWPSTVPTLFAPLALVCAYVPILLLGGVGRMRVRTLIVWGLAATALLALMAWYGAARQTTEQLAGTQPFISFPLAAFSAAALFIIHHLVLPADRARRWLADFPAYFDAAWKSGVQLVLSLAFVGVFWAILGLGAALFHVIGLPFLTDLISEEWFAIPVTCLVFAAAVHLADVRDGLIRGVRSVSLMLLSWLLPLMTLLATGFLVALPFTGLDGLFETGSATALVLSASAGLIILINTAYQDGREDNRPPAVLRWSVRLAALLLTPLVAIAFWGLFLRIGQHGLTPDRIIALACAVVGAEHAVGYAFASIIGQRHGRWMQPLERTNIWGAVLAALLIVVLFSPLVDPARLSVNDQVARLERGAVSEGDFDYHFLRFESGAAGMAALRHLARSDDNQVSARAREILASRDRWSTPRAGRPDVTPRYEIVPEGAVLPSTFIGPVEGTDDRSFCKRGSPCYARPIDIDGDEEPEVLLWRYQLELWDQTSEGWTAVAAYELDTCGPRVLIESMAAAVPTESPWPTLDLGNGVSAYPKPHRICEPGLNHQPLSSGS
jgi:hypothetical protein